MLYKRFHINSKYTRGERTPPNEQRLHSSFITSVWSPPGRGKNHTQLEKSVTRLEKWDYKPNTITQPIGNPLIDQQLLEESRHTYTKQITRNNSAWERFSTWGRHSSYLDEIWICPWKPIWCPKLTVLIKLTFITFPWLHAFKITFLIKWVLEICWIST